MYTILAFSFFHFSSTAMAGNLMDPKPWSLAAKMGSVENVQFVAKSKAKDGKLQQAASRAETPLYHRPSKSSTPYVAITTSDKKDAKKWLFNISTSSNSIIVSKSFAKANKLEIVTTNKRLIPYPKEYRVGGKVEYVVIPKLYIGDMVLENVTAALNTTEMAPKKDLLLGLGAIDQIGYTISNSTGTIHFYPASIADKELAKLNGKATSFQRVGWSIVKWGTERKVAPSYTLMVESKVGTKKVLSALESSKFKSTITRYHPESRIKKVDQAEQQDYFTVQIGEAEKSYGWFDRNGVFIAIKGMPGILQNDAFIASNILNRYDMAVDPRNYRVSLKKVYKYQWTDGDKLLVEQKKAALDKKVQDKKKVNANDWRKLSNMYYDMKDHRNSLAMAEKATAKDPTNCLNWQQQAYSAAALGNWKKAQKSAQHTATLFAGWWSLDLDTRLWYKKKMDDYKKSLNADEKKALKTKLKELVNKDLKAGKLATESKNPNKENSIGHNNLYWISQSSSCHFSYGKLAQTAIAQGQPGKVEKIYRKHLDLDPWLAIYQGSAALIQHNQRKANEAFRQAIKLATTDKQNAYARLGLALYFADKGEWRFAQPLFEKAAELFPKNNLITYLWLDNARTNSKTPKENLKRAKAWRNHNPTSPAAHVAYLREARLGQFSKEFTKIQKDTEQFFHEQLQLRAPSPMLIGSYVQFLVLSNRLEDAKTTLAKYRYLRNKPAILLAKADLLAVQGKMEKSNEMLIKAAKMVPEHPGFAVFLQKDALQ